MLNGLSDKQKDAVTSADFYTLVLAGAGSGKTRCLTSRVGYLIDQDNSPGSILTVTFTNKAASEMKNRLSNMIDVKGLWVGTFHSTCVRILRRFGQHIGLINKFTIYDTDNTKSILKKIMQNYGQKAGSFDITRIAGAISNWKNQLKSASQVDNDWQVYPERYWEDAVKCYVDYQKELRRNGAVDFDDLIALTVDLLQRAPEVKKWAHKFKHILVDEYQDINYSQYVLVQQLLSSDCSLWVAGDPDQSIYGWRGADITNIVNFQQDFPNAKLVKLEQNYRSSSTIVEAADAVVVNNQSRLPKTSYSKKGQGVPIKIMKCRDEKHEAETVILLATQLKQLKNIDYNDMAILYRTNAQYRAVEAVLLENMIPYTIVGGIGFFQRKEIKDLVSYLTLLANPLDTIAFERVALLHPGIGKKTVQSLIINQNSIDLIATAANSSNKKIKELGGFLVEMQTYATLYGPGTALEEIIKATDYKQKLHKEDAYSYANRETNIEQLINLAGNYKMITEFLTNASLASMNDQDGPGIKLMTIHAAKGLEFATVFLIGMENGLFPHANSIHSAIQMEEERRLAYVAITRAEKFLFITYAKERLLNGRHMYNAPSQFLYEIPTKLIQGDLPSEYHNVV